MALKIYGIPRSRAFRTLWMAKELGLEYENIAVAEVRLFDRFLQRHRAKRNRVLGMHQMHFGGPRQSRVAGQRIRRADGCVVVPPFPKTR